MSDEIIEGMSREVAIFENTRALAVARDPVAVLDEARRVATALASVLQGKDHKVMMGGEQYLELEDWELLGRFYGVTAMMEGEPAYVVMGSGEFEVHGFKATALAIINGNSISRATAFCLDDEEKWGERPKYAWGYCCVDGSWSVEDPGKDQLIWEEKRNGPGRAPKKEKRQIGMERVPTFQLASMAQTRACSKVLGLVLRWVPVLAGYKGTPAEEVDAQAEVVVQDREHGMPSAGVQTEGERRAAEPAGPAEDRKVKAWRPVLMSAIGKIPEALEHLAIEVRLRGLDDAAYSAYLAKLADGVAGGLSSLTFGTVLDNMPKLPGSGAEGATAAVEAVAGSETQPEPAAADSDAAEAGSGEAAAVSTDVDRSEDCPHCGASYADPHVPECPDYQAPRDDFAVDPADEAEMKRKLEALDKPSQAPTFDEAAREIAKQRGGK